MASNSPCFFPASPEADGPFHHSALPAALVAVKTLARIPAGSEVLIKPEVRDKPFVSLARPPPDNPSIQNLRTLYEFARDTRPGVSAESLKCVANAILLLEPARDAWLHIGGGQLALDLLIDPNSTPEFSFLSARILFLTTMKQNAFLRRIAEDSKVIEAMAAVSPSPHSIINTNVSHVTAYSCSELMRF